jgi:hypothetical protein
LQFIARGVFDGDTLPTRKATGKKFAYQGCIVMEIDGEGKTTRGDEYYSVLHDECPEVELYRQVKS